MDRRTFLLCLAGLPTLVLAKPSNCCPICGGSLTVVGKVTDITSLPSKNVRVWNRSYHGDPAYPFNDESPICSRCFIAYSHDTDKWCISNESVESFFVPLQPSVAGLPSPPTSMITSLVVYNQEFMGIGANGGRLESVGFWFRNSPRTLDAMRIHSASNRLDLRVKADESEPGETYVMASTATVTFEQPRVCATGNV
jgi:hypothetical protein